MVKEELHVRLFPNSAIKHGLITKDEVKIMLKGILNFKKKFDYTGIDMHVLYMMQYIDEKGCLANCSFCGQSKKKLFYVIWK